MFFLCLRRIFGIIPVTWLVLTFTFLMLRYIPGGPFDYERTLPPEALAAIEDYYGHGEPLAVQYMHFFGKILSGDLGPSYRQVGWSVWELVSYKMMVSFTLGACALLLSICTALALGIVQAMGHGSWWDRLLNHGELLLLCIPAYVLGPILSHIFAGKLHWINAFGWGNFSQGILPVITLATYSAAFMGRLIRNGMHEQWSQLYVRTAVAKGLSPWKIFFHHVLLNGIQPFISYLGPCCAAILSGTFVVENLFNIPGMGRLFIHSIYDRDYAVISGILLIYSFLIVICNLLSDILLLLIDPRIQRREN
ncbi:MAG: ABC transporter permease [Puniceicoccales bacterium]|jgi:oligopeptide transport system permease protein|nr:ABC transporter permease [Puniceicoccales bacterium]